ncbi:MAG: hypothetical protein AAF481_07915 [Acidobacteriota bacterium]
MNDREAQKALAEIALQLVGIEDRLQRIHDEFPQAPNQQAMWEHRIPRDVASEIYATIECVLVDQLRPTIKQLEAASQVTDTDLRHRFDSTM